MGKENAGSVWLASIAASAFATQIRFSGQDAAHHLSERSVAGAFGRRFGERVSARVVGGAVLGGELERSGEHFDVGPGWLAGVGVAANWNDVGWKHWFFGASLTIAISSAHTTGGAGERHGLLAEDNRIGLIYGRVFADRWKPYLLARAFFGPVKWTIAGNDVTGSDTHHYAVGLGGSFTISKGFDVFAEESYFGERSLALGAALVF